MVVFHTKKYSVEPEDYLNIENYLRINDQLKNKGWKIFRISKAKEVVETYDESSFPVHTYNFKKCTIIGTVQELSEGGVIKGFLEIGSGDIENIIKLKSYLERKIGSELEEIDMIKCSSLTQ